MSPFRPLRPQKVASRADSQSVRRNELENYHTMTCQYRGVSDVAKNPKVKEVSDGSDVEQNVHPKIN